MACERWLLALLLACALLLSSGHRLQRSTALQPGDQAREEAEGEAEEGEEGPEKTDRAVAKALPTRCIGGDCGCGKGSGALFCGARRLKCPHAGGVCCGGGSHCCPSGYQCGKVEGHQCPMCIKSKHSCPGKSFHPSTGLHAAAKGHCSKLQAAHQAQHCCRKDCCKEECCGEEDNRDAPEPRESVRSCGQFLSRDEPGCPEHTKPLANANGVSCNGHKDCQGKCCVRSAAPYSCGNFYAERMCHKSNLASRGSPALHCDKGDSCLQKCCAPRKTRSCKEWLNKNRCAAGSRDTGEEQIQCSATDNDNCQKLCCRRPDERQQHSCQDLFEGVGCPKGSRPKESSAKDTCDMKSGGCAKQCCTAHFTCSALWKAGCPNGGKPNTKHINLPCVTERNPATGKQDPTKACIQQCCLGNSLEKTCTGFWQNPGCPSEFVEHKANAAETCQGGDCASVCCQRERPKSTCTDWWAQNRCAAPKHKLTSNDKEACNGNECAELCCKSPPTCGQWLEGDKCPADKEEDPGARDKPCQPLADGGAHCKVTCCRPLSPRQKSCGEFWLTGSCPRTAPVPNTQHKLSKCSGENCMRVCCMPTPPTCETWWLKSECPREWEQKAKAENKRCSGQSCVAECCQKLPPTCESWWTDNTCPVPERPVRTQENTHKRCQGMAQCEATCCKPEPPFLCAHFWQKERCPVNKPINNHANRAVQCKGASCVDKCCKPRPPQPTCEFFWYSEGCTKSKQKPRLANKNAKCQGQNCLALCCTPPPPFVASSRVCRATGDPHFFTFDGNRFNWYAEGEFVMYDDPENGEQIQNRQLKHTPGSRVSWDTGCAFRSGKDVVAFSLESPKTKFDPRLFINGKPTAFRHGSVHHAGNLLVHVGWQNGRSPHGARIVTITSKKSGTKVQLLSYARSYWRWIDLYITARGFYRPARTGGLCGRFDQNRGADYVLRNGQMLSASHANAQRMAESWRVLSKEHLFTLREPHFAKGGGGGLAPLQACRGDSALLLKAFQACHKVQEQMRKACVTDFCVEGGTQKVVQEMQRTA